MRRRDGRRPPTPAQWEAVTTESLHQWPLLDEAERQKLAERGFDLLGKRWEAARGFRVDDTMRIAIAANAALLTIGRDDDLYRNVTAIVVHRANMVMREERPGPSRGVVTRAPLVVSGHTSSRGPVFISWSEVERGGRTQQRSTNVILHEFAHKIDALSGMLDGTPPLHPPALQRWVEVCTAAFDALRRRDVAPFLRSYAATSPSEFFAVATETFFEQPLGLRDARPELYDVLRDFYRQDTAARELRAAPPPDALP